MADDEDIAALVVDNGSGMCKGEFCFDTHVQEEMTMDSHWRQLLVVMTRRCGNADLSMALGGEML